MKESGGTVAGLILAAGQSKRMGRSKMTMTWGKETIIGQVTHTFLAGGAKPVVVVTGGMREEVEAALHGLPIYTVFNQKYATGGMISSVQLGLQALPIETCAALIALGDQPQTEVEIVKSLINAFLESRALLVVPSYRMRRGHPWLVGRALWQEILDLQPPQSLRDFLERQEPKIHYLQVDHASVVQDIDTMEQYLRYCPKQ